MAPRAQSLESSSSRRESGDKPKESEPSKSHLGKKRMTQTSGDVSIRHRPLIPPTISLPILVIIDMFSVSLVVPLLFSYFESAGVKSAGQRELLSSLFSASQIIGGLALGALVDSGFLRRRTVLLISFAGSALSYALILYGEFWAIVCSRILVGLVKQTMTVTTTMLAQYTRKEERARHIGRLRASSTIAWVVGPSIGAFLYKNVDRRAPPALACALFISNVVIGLAILPNDEGTRKGEFMRKEGSRGKKVYEFLTSLQTCFKSRAVGSLILSLLMFMWLLRATSYANMASEAALDWV